jgi:large subunit ribosomal protein L9
MKILFTKNVARQGQVGDVKEVADGYAQFLINAGNATKATNEVVKANENKIKNAKMKSEGEEKYIFELAKLLKNEIIKISVNSNPKGSLYKSLHKKEIVAEVSKLLKLDFEDKYLEEITLKEKGVFDIAIVYKNKKVGSFQVELL